MAHATGVSSCRACTEHGLALDDGDISYAPAGKVVGSACAHAASTYDDGISGFPHTFDSMPAWQAKVSARLCPALVFSDCPPESTAESGTYSGSSKSRRSSHHHPVLPRETRPACRSGRS